MQVRDKEEPSDVTDVELCRLGTRKNLVMSQV